MTETRSTCPYCGVGCGVLIASDGERITGVRGDPDHPANHGRLCSKGSTLHLTAAPHVQLQVRALHPQLRAERTQARQRVTWDQALDTVADRLAAIVERHGSDAVGLYLSGQLLTEDYYVFNKLGKGLIGTNNVDTNSRLCMSSAVAGYKRSLGADAPPSCYEDIDHAQTVFITGSNMAWAHPVLFRRLEDARRGNATQRWIVVDPRRTETAAMADLHLQILPGTDVVLHHALLHLMLWEGLTDTAWIAAHTTGFEALRDRVREFSPAAAAKTCGVREADIVQAARWFAGLDGAAGARQPTLSLYCQGLNQSSSGTDKNSTLINLHLATGQIGRPGAGPFSLTGQPNAMGGREVGGLANLLSAHRDLANPQHRAEVAALWGVRDVPGEPGQAAVQMFEAAAEGRIRALWIVCTNPLQSLPDSALVRRALERAEFVVVQDAYRTTATAAFADVLLPATTWGEKDGTVTNSERCISRVRAAVAPQGEARDDWRIAVEVARRLEARLPSRRAAGLERVSMFGYADAAAVWAEHRESTRGRDLDITGLSYAALEAAPAPWPCPSPAEGSLEAPRPRQRLYEDGRFPTEDGRARFVAPAWRGVAEPRDAHYPTSLITGRLRDQWHGMSRTGTLGRLFAHSPQPAVELHPQDLLRRRLRDGDLVRVRSRRGEQILPVRANADLAPAQAFIAMHWGPEWLSGAGVNALTPRASCPTSRQPELKHAAVRIEPASLPWRVVAAAWLPADRALIAQQRLREAFQGHAFASCTLFGREPEPVAGEPPGAVGVLFHAARSEAPDPARLAAELAPLESALDLGMGAPMRYADPRHGQLRCLQPGSRRSPAGLSAGRRHARRSLGAGTAAATRAGLAIWPPAAVGEPAAARGADAEGCAGLHLSRRRPRPHRRAAAELRRHARRAPAQPADAAEVWHVLRQLPARAACARARHADSPPTRRPDRSLGGAAATLGFDGSRMSMSMSPTDPRACAALPPSVTLVGAGPGAPDLLTVRAVKALRRATVALVDDLVDPGVLRYLRPSARVIPVGKRGGCVSTPQAFIHKLMVAEARRGERVVRLKGGDPFVFGRGGEEVDALREAGIEVEVVSGLTAGIAGPAAIGIPVTDRRCAPGVALITGHLKEAEGADPQPRSAPNWAALARSGLTLVVYMGVSRATSIADELIGHGMHRDTPAAVVGAAHTARQRHVRATLGTLAQALCDEAITAPAVLVIGQVASLGAVLADAGVPSALAQHAADGAAPPRSAAA